MISLTQNQVQDKIKFINDYINAKNAADGSKYDANANVSNKNIATLSAELFKNYTISINRHLVYEKLKENFDTECADEFLRQLKDHEIYVNDETSLMPYTYSHGECVSVIHKGKKFLISLELLYDKIDIEEFLEDPKNEVWVKYPKDLYIEDYYGKKQILRLVKKKRHRDLYRIKLDKGEDLIVTDNHPLIIDKNNINNTIDAIDSLNKIQFKKDLTFNSNIREIDLLKEFPNEFEDIGDFLLLKSNKGSKIEGIRKRINLSPELGYVIGFFIAEGNFSSDSKKGLDKPVLKFTQNSSETLKKISNYIFKETGIVGKVIERKKRSIDKNQSYSLLYTSRILYLLFKKYFEINQYSYNKNLPLNILETNIDFINGLIAGIIDGDGSVSNSRISIRLASRTCINQLVMILRMFKIGVVTTFQDTSNDNIKSHFFSTYPTFGITFSKSDILDFKLSYKLEGVNRERKSLYQTDENKIIKVQKIENKKFLEKYIYDITTETGSFICNNILVHNCSSVSLYPFLLNGLKGFGGETEAPKHLSSFCGGFINLIFALSSQFAGAIASVEFLMLVDFFARKDFGENYLETHAKEIEQEIQSVVYALNQPAAARGFQSVFFNTSIYDKYYFESMFGNFVFPDMTKPNYESISKLQKFFMKWFNQERTKAVLTFPVITAACINDGNELKDKDFEDFITTELSEGNSFFIYTSDSADSLSSCCRLRNDISDSINDFSFSLGCGGTMTGSKKVITLNYNRLIQDNRDLETEIKKIHKYLYAYELIFQDYYKNNMFPAMNSGYITLDKQFLTIGLNGVVEGCEYLGYDISNNSKYLDFLSSEFEKISKLNKIEGKKYGVKFNTEMIPGESVGYKFAQWDKKDGYVVPRDVYNSYFYKVEDENISIIDKFEMMGKKTCLMLDGGSALHVNLEEYCTKEGFKKLINVAVKEGCPYFCFNVKITICNDCENIDKRTLKVCPKCGSKNLDYATRIIGYLKRISSFSSPRQIEESKRFYS